MAWWYGYEFGLAWPAYLLLVQLEGGLDQISQGSQLLLLLILSLLDLRTESMGGKLNIHWMCSKINRDVHTHTQNDTKTQTDARNRTPTHVQSAELQTRRSDAAEK